MTHVIGGKLTQGMWRKHASLLVKSEQNVTTKYISLKVYGASLFLKMILNKGNKVQLSCDLISINYYEVLIFYYYVIGTLLQLLKLFLIV